MSNEMNPWLAAYYNTHGAGDAAAEEQEKVAQVKLFCKLAAERGIDMSEWSNEEIENFYEKVFPDGIPKEAQEEEGSKEDEAEDKKEEAKKESKEESKEEPKEASAAAEAYHQEKVAFQEKFAEADLMGRVMAHAFTNELELIKQAMEKDAQEEEGSKEDEEEDKKEEESKEDKKEEGNGEKKPLPPFMQKKEGSADSRAMQFERLAMEQGIKTAAAAGYDKDLVSTRVNAVATLGLPESEKIASVQDTNMALHVRGLEYLEAAGVPVDWNEVFGEQK